MVVIGLENCGRCKMVKKIFDEKNITYEYHVITEFSEEKQKEYMNVGRQSKKGANTYPLIFDEENNLIDFQDVIKI